MVSIETQLPPRSAVVSPRGPSGCESDQLIVARLAGAAQRHAPWREPTAAQRHAPWREPTAAQRHAPWREPTEAETAAAVAELREIAGGRADLLAEAAGLLTGFYRRTSEETRARAAAHYCVVAGARHEEIPHWIEVGRSRAAAARQDSDAGQRHRRDDPGAST